MIKFVDIKIGDDVTFYALIENMQKRFTPNKSGYYGATLSDGDSSIDARIWDCNLVESKDITAGNVYRFTAHVNEYAGKAQYVIKNIETISEDEIDISKFFKCAPLSKDDLNKGIKSYLKKITNPTLYKLAVNLIAKVAPEYFEYPAAMSMHHNFLHGLAYHTYTMLNLAEKLLELYPGMNSNLLYTGVILHDIGKTKELSGSKAPVYTQDGNLLGHIVIGLQMVAVAASEEGVSDTEEVRMLEHMIASHHGELEYGSPKEPGIMEAYALHLIDLMDSKMAAISPEVSKTKKGQSTSPIGSLGRKALYVPDLD
jgi:3'-5' exoribonuclease